VSSAARIFSLLLSIVGGNLSLRGINVFPKDLVPEQDQGTNLQVGGALVVRPGSGLPNELICPDLVCPLFFKHAWPRHTSVSLYVEKFHTRDSH
jgi:hypothetical protein